MVFIILSGSSPSQLINGPHIDLDLKTDKNGFLHKTGFNKISPVGAQDFVDASESSVNSVVHITTTVVKTSFQRDPFYEFFYGPGSGGREFEQRGQASGSGVIITGDGYIVTNNHVIESASEIEVVLNDNRKYKAIVVGADPSTDIAVLKIEEKKISMRSKQIWQSVYKKGSFEIDSLTTFPLELRSKLNSLISPFEKSLINFFVFFS